MILVLLLKLNRVNDNKKMIKLIIVVIAAASVVVYCYSYYFCDYECKVAVL